MTISDRSRQDDVPRIVLIGMRGSGKTTVGRELARRCGGRHVDTDQLICDSTGSTIAEIFARDGETAFREMESAAIEEALAGTAKIISVGGGAIESRESQSRLRGAGCVVWLTAPVDVLFARVAADPMTAHSRPALTAASGVEEFRTLLARREPAYRSTAHVVIDTARKEPAEMVDEVVIAARRWADANRS